MIIICQTFCNNKNSALCQTLFSVCYVWFSQKTPIVCLNNIKQLLFRKHTERVFWEAGTEFLCKLGKRRYHFYYFTLPVELYCIYLLTPWNRVLLEKLTGSAASQEIPRIFGTRRFITVLTSARHLSLSWANSIQSPQPPPTSWRSILILSFHLRLGLPNCLFSSGFPTRTLYTPLPCPERAILHIQYLIPTLCNKLILRITVDWNKTHKLGNVRVPLLVFNSKKKCTGEVFHSLLNLLFETLFVRWTAC